MQMYYCDDEDGVVEFMLKTDPPEGLYWSTYQLKKSDIEIITKMDRSGKARMRDKILRDIFATQPNIRTTKKSN